MNVVVYFYCKSIEFHEGGRRHQANVKKQLQQARTRSAENAKEKLNVEKTLSAIEHVAFSAYQKDLAGGHVKKAKLPVSPVVEQSQLVQDSMSPDEQALEREMEKKVIEFKAQQKVQEIQTKALEQAYQSYSSSYIYATQSVSPWQQCYSPEGYVYYYNSMTGGKACSITINSIGLFFFSPVTQWEVPGGGFQPASQPLSIPPSTASQLPPYSSVAVTTASSDSSATTGGNSLKRPSEKAEVEERDTHQPPKRKGPYGSWTTVAVVERDVEEKVGTGESEEQDTEDAPPQEEEIQFEEKTISGELSEELRGEFKGFAFKKRTNKERPQIRQRIGDV